MGRPAKNLIGQQFGNLIVLERAGSTSDGHALWKCECQCSEHKIVYKTSNKLQKKNSTPSCGCLVHKLISQAAKDRYKDLTEQKKTAIVKSQLFTHGLKQVENSAMFYLLIIKMLAAMSAFIQMKMVML